MRKVKAFASLRLSEQGPFQSKWDNKQRCVINKDTQAQTRRTRDNRDNAEDPKSPVTNGWAIEELQHCFGEGPLDFVTDKKGKQKGPEELGYSRGGCGPAVSVAGASGFSWFPVNGCNPDILWRKRKNEKVIINYFKAVSCAVINFHSNSLIGKIRKHQGLYHTPHL